MDIPTTDAGRLRLWLTWAGERLAGIPEPTIVDRIEAEALPTVERLARALDKAWIAPGDERGPRPPDLAAAILAELEKQQ